MTLAEALVTMALIGFIFLIIADLLESASKTIRFANYKTAAEQGEQIALQRLTCEAREAVNITYVGPNGLNLTRIDDSVNRFTSAPPSAWPYTPMMKVSYYLNGTNLMRSVTTSTLSPPAQVIASGISVIATANDTMVTGNNAPSNLDVQLTFEQEDDIVQVVNVTVWLPTCQ
jgi:hypothetical protein